MLPRRTAAINGDRRVSFATYFNAFPASYWRRWTSVDAVTLRIRLAGEASVVIYRSAARGHSHPVETIRVHTDEPETIERTLSLTPFIDGGWYWFDIVAGPRGATLVEAEWVALTQPAPPGGSASASPPSTGRCTCWSSSASWATRRTCVDLLDAVYVVDQGTTKVRDHPDYADATKNLGEKLHVIEQGNIGGSGGFARGMYETLQAGESDYVLILDDDIKPEPEGILRAATFADLARRPTIVGGHMFSMYDPSVLHAFAEVVAQRKWWWGAAPNTKVRHDFGRRNLRNTPWLHRRADSDYNGWWECLIPTRIIREIGLSLPVFIKSGRRRVRAAGPQEGLPHGLDAGLRLLARAVDGQERRRGLAGVLPPA